MPEIGELVTTTKVFGIETLIQLGATTREQVTLLREELRTAMATVEDQVGAITAATDNIAGDLTRIKEQLDAAVADTQGQVDAAVSERLQAVADGLQGPVDRLNALAAENPEPTPEPAPPVEPTPGEPAPGTPVDPNAPTP